MTFAQLGGNLEPINPPPALKRAVDTRLGLLSDAAAPARKRSWTWPAIAAGLGALALGEFALLMTQPGRETIVRESASDPAPDSYVALLAADEGPTPILASLDLPQGLLTIDPSGLEAGDRAVQLWLLPAGGGAPVSLGLLAPNRDNTVEVPVSFAGLGKGELPSLAVSLEPDGGSPTGAPTGPVIASGRVRALSRN